MMETIADETHIEQSDTRPRWTRVADRAKEIMTGDDIQDVLHKLADTDNFLVTFKSLMEESINGGPWIDKAAELFQIVEGYATAMADGEVET